MTVHEIFRDAEKVFLSAVNPERNQVFTIDMSELFDEVRDEFSEKAAYEEMPLVSGDPADPYYIFDIVTKNGEYHQVRTADSTGNIIQIDNELTMYHYTGRGMGFRFRSYFGDMHNISKSSSTIEEYVQARDRRLLVGDGND